MRILVTRPEPDASKQARQLVERGHEAIVSPLLTFDSCARSNLDVAGAQAVIVTSRNAVRALGQARTTGDVFRLPVFAVGPATAHEAFEAGFSDVREGPGDARSLATFIAESADPRAGALVHIRGERTAFDLNTALTEAGFRVHGEIVYRMRAAIALSGTAQDVLTSGGLDGVILMSPHTAQLFCEIADKGNLREICADLQYFCLSQAVAEALLPPLPVHVNVAAKPNAEELLALVDAIAAQSGQ